MFGQGMYGGGPFYGMYGYGAAEAGQQPRGRLPGEREPAPAKFTEVGGPGSARQRPCSSQAVPDAPGRAAASSRSRR